MDHINEDGYYQASLLTITTPQIRNTNTLAWVFQIVDPFYSKNPFCVYVEKSEADFYHHLAKVGIPESMAKCLNLENINCIAKNIYFWIEVEHPIGVSPIIIEICGFCGYAPKPYF